MLDATVDEDLAEAVAALAVKSSKGKFSDGKKGGGSGGGGSGGGAGSGSSCGAGSGGGSGVKSYFICDRHWQFGGKAYRCDAPSKCQWQAGN